MERYLSCLPRLTSDLGLGCESTTVAVVEAVEEVAERVGEEGATMLSREVDGCDMVVDDGGEG